MSVPPPPQPRHASLNRRRPAQQLSQLGDVHSDAPGLVADELGPRHRLPAHGEKMLAYKAEQRLGTGKTMRRREFIALMGASVAWPFAAMAQQAGRTYRLGTLFAGRLQELWDAFLDPALQHGFVEGRNLTADYRDYAQHVDLLSEWAVELTKSRVDVIAAAGDPAIRAAQKATQAIPILAITDDMLGAGLVNSLARPDGNTTGVSILATELDGKRQDILIETVPGLRRMVALADSNRAAVKLEALQEAARARNIELSIQRIASSEEIAAAIDMAHASGATALNVLASPLLYANRKLIIDRATALRLPAIYQWPRLCGKGLYARHC